MGEMRVVTVGRVELSGDERRFSGIGQIADWVVLVYFRNFLNCFEGDFAGRGLVQLHTVNNYQFQPLTAADSVGENGAEIGKSAVVFDDIGFGGDEWFVFPALNPADPEDLNCGGHLCLLSSCHEYA